MQSGYSLCLHRTSNTEPECKHGSGDSGSVLPVCRCLWIVA